MDIELRTIQRTWTTWTSRKSNHKESGNCWWHLRRLWSHPQYHRCRNHLDSLAFSHRSDSPFPSLQPRCNITTRSRLPCYILKSLMCVAEAWNLAVVSWSVRLQPQLRSISPFARPVRYTTGPYDGRQLYCWPHRSLHLILTARRQPPGAPPATWRNDGASSGPSGSAPFSSLAPSHSQLGRAIMPATLL